MSKRGALDAFFLPTNKKPKATSFPSTCVPESKSSLQPIVTAKSTTTADSELEPSPFVVPPSSHPPCDHVHSQPPSIHATYPFPIRPLPPTLLAALALCPSKDARVINNAPDLNLLYYAAFTPASAAKQLFTHLRSSLPFYRVTYTIKRGATEILIRAPRYTTVFGVDCTSTFSDSATTSEFAVLVDSKTKTPVPKSRYKAPPRPLPSALQHLQNLTEAITGETFNFCLVNYYAHGADSISYHSDDERFLGPDPSIASFSLGARRDFLMKHKPAVASTVSKDGDKENKLKEKDKDKPATLKLPLAPGDMILMRGRTQANWLHSIPKRSGPGSDGGHINITFRKAMTPAGTDNYYRYNVGEGGVFVWDERGREMVPCRGDGQDRTRDLEVDVRRPEIRHT